MQTRLNPGRSHGEVETFGKLWDLHDDHGNRFGTVAEIVILRFRKKNGWSPCTVAYELRTVKGNTIRLEVSDYPNASVAFQEVLKYARDSRLCA